MINKSLKNTITTVSEVHHSWEDDEATDVDMEGVSYWLLTLMSGLAGIILIVLAIIF